MGVYSVLCVVIWGAIIVDHVIQAHEGRHNKVTETAHTPKAYKSKRRYHDLQYYDRFPTSLEDRKKEILDEYREHKPHKSRDKEYGRNDVSHDLHSTEGKNSVNYATDRKYGIEDIYRDRKYGKADIHRDRKYGIDDLHRDRKYRIDDPHRDHKFGIDDLHKDRNYGISDPHRDRNYGIDGRNPYLSSAEGLYLPPPPPPPHIHPGTRYNGRYSNPYRSFPYTHEGFPYNYYGFPYDSVRPVLMSYRNSQPIRDDKHVFEYTPEDYNCPGNGMFYRDSRSFYHCHDNRFNVQFCAPGSLNVAKMHYDVDRSYTEEYFCTFNMVSLGHPGPPYYHGNGRGNQHDKHIRQDDHVTDDQSKD